MEVADHLMQAAGQPFGAEQHRSELAEQQVEEATLPEVARLDVRGREDSRVDTVAPAVVQDAERLEASGVEVELVTRALPHTDGTSEAHRVEDLPTQVAVPELVIAPREQPIVVTCALGSGASVGAA